MHERRTHSFFMRVNTRAAFVAVLIVPLGAQVTQRVSVNSSGQESNGYSDYPSLSADGRYVAFHSFATNLVTGDTEGFLDVFVHDVQSGSTERVSISTSGDAGNGGSSASSISGDGRYVAFQSAATNLVNGDANGIGDIFVHDRLNDTTARVSVHSSGAEANGASDYPWISADGRYVAFQSYATNLVNGDTNGEADVFVHDVQSGSTERVSIFSNGVQGDNSSAEPSISADGRYVAFWSAATNLVLGDTNGHRDVFVRDRVSGTTERVSLNSSGAEGNGNSYFPAISADGRYVAFESIATDLVVGDTNQAQDVLVHDRLNGTTERVSLNSSGVEGNGNSRLPSISADGRYVAFWGYSSNLAIGDTNTEIDVFVRDRQSGTTELLSVNSCGVQGNNASYDPSISADGRYVAFQSHATNLVIGDTNGYRDIFVRDRDGYATPFCFGDATGFGCPCGNTGDPCHGCASSADFRGGLLRASGTPSIGADSLCLEASFLPQTTSGLFFQGNQRVNSGLGRFFGDGLRCVGGSVYRLGVRVASGGVIRLGACVPGDPVISTFEPVPAGSTRYYQVWYRNADTTFCTTSLFNLTNALSVEWQP